MSVVESRQPLRRWDPKELSWGPGERRVVLFGSSQRGKREEDPIEDLLRLGPVCASEDSPGTAIKSLATGNGVGHRAVDGREDRSKKVSLTLNEPGAHAVGEEGNTGTRTSTESSVLPPSP